MSDTTQQPIVKPKRIRRTKKQIEEARRLEAERKENEPHSSHSSSPKRRKVKVTNKLSNTSDGIKRKKKTEESYVNIGQMLGATSTGRRTSPKVGLDDGNSQLKIMKRDEEVSVKIDVQTYELDDYMEESSSPSSSTNSSSFVPGSLILQIPVTVDDINEYSKSNFRQSNAIEYDPEDLIVSGPKPMIVPSQAEQVESKVLFVGCKKCINTTEGSLLPCEKCKEKFNSYKQTINDLLLERANQDALYSRPDPAKFNNRQIIETRLPENIKDIEYEPDIIIDVHPNIDGSDILGVDSVTSVTSVSVSELEESPYTKKHSHSHSHSHTSVLHTSTDDSSSEKSTKTRSDTTRSKTAKLTLRPEDALPIRFNILNEFISLEKWPKQTNVFCWWDCHGFTNTPIGIPLKFEHEKKKFVTYGCFCSFECAMAYKKDDSRLKDISTDIFYNLRSKIIGENIKGKIKSALPRKTLNIFGGELSIEAFRNYSTNNDIVCDVVMYPLMPIVETVDIYNTLGGIKSGSGGSPKLKLKRTKPLPGAVNTLQNTLNMINNK